MYWFTNNLISIAQVRLLSLNYVKNLFGFATQRKGITMEGPMERMQTREAMRIRKLKEKKYVTFILFKNLVWYTISQGYLEKWTEHFNDYQFYEMSSRRGYPTTLLGYVYNMNNFICSNMSIFWPFWVEHRIQYGIEFTIFSTKLWQISQWTLTLTCSEQFSQHSLGLYTDRGVLSSPNN